MSSGTRRRPLFVAAVLLTALAAVALPAAEVLHDHPIGRDPECQVCERGTARDAVRPDGTPLPVERGGASLRLAETDAKIASSPVPRSQGARAPPA